MCVCVCVCPQNCVQLFVQYVLSEQLHLQLSLTSHIILLPVGLFSTLTVTC